MPDTVHIFSAWQVISFILGSVVVIFGAYFATYLLARGSQKMYKGRAIQIVDRFSLSKDKSIVVLSVYDKVYVTAFSASAVAVLDKLDAEAVDLPDTESAPLPYWAGKSPLGALKGLAKKLPFIKNTAHGANIPFELYLQQEEAAQKQEAAQNRDDIDAVYVRMQNRRGKEDQYSAFSDAAYLEEDIRK